MEIKEAIRGFRERASKENGNLDGTASKFCTILGLQSGDEGKGKLIDLLAENYDITARFNAGNDADHMVEKDGVKYAFHLLPCGMLYNNCKCVIGTGVVVNVESLFTEIKQLEENGIQYKDRLFVSARSHLATKLHVLADQFADYQDGDTKRVTSSKGIGKLLKYTCFEDPNYLVSPTNFRFGNQ